MFQGVLKLRPLAPSPDMIFDKWLNSLSSDDIKNFFGISDRKAISAAEHVKKVTKGGLFIFQSHAVVSAVQSEVKSTERVSVSKIRKITFHELEEVISKEEWKHETAVPSFSTIRTLNCDACNGSGKSPCKSCGVKGHVNCKDCEGEGDVDCPNCNGKKRVTVKIEINDKSGKKVKEEKRITCASCHGIGKLRCKTCKGLRKIQCPTCKAKVSSCKNCEGHGKIFEYKVVTVPLVEGGLKEKSHEYISTSFSWMLSSKDHGKNLRTAESYQFASLRDFTEEKVAELLAMPKIEKELRDAFKQCHDAFLKLQKDYKNSKSGRKPKLPITLYFLTSMEVETKKGKSFHLVAVGTKDRFSISMKK